MIKINVITNNNNWYKIIKNPVKHIARKIDKINRFDKTFKKKAFIAHYFFQATGKLKILIKNLEKKINQQMFYRFHFIMKKI